MTSLTTHDVTIKKCFPGPKDKNRDTLDLVKRQSIIIVMQNGRNKLSKNFATKFPLQKMEYFDMELNSSPNSNGDLIISHAHSGATN